MIKSLDDVSNVSTAHHVWIFYNYDVQSLTKKMLLHLWEEMITLVRSLLEFKKFEVDSIDIYKFSLYYKGITKNYSVCIW